jgi:hypothetical protein
MELTKEQLEAKRTEYVNQKQQAQADLNNSQFRIALFEGAIQDCDYWISQLEPPKE